MAEPDHAENAPNQPETDESPDRPSDNPSVARCIRAGRRAYQKKLNELNQNQDDESDEGEIKYEAWRTARLYYLRAMPPLVGSDNIRDFLACVTYASAAEIIRPDDANHYLAAAKIALGTLRTDPRPRST